MSDSYLAAVATRSLDASAAAHMNNTAADCTITAHVCMVPELAQRIISFAADKMLGDDDDLAAGAAVLPCIWNTCQLWRSLIMDIALHDPWPRSGCSSESYASG